MMGGLRIDWGTIHSSVATKRQAGSPSRRHPERLQPLTSHAKPRIVSFVQVAAFHPVAIQSVDVSLSSKIPI